MSVILNEAAITKLFTTPNGPVALFVERKAEEIIADAMRFDIKSYFVGADTGVEDDVGLVMNGSTALVGLRDDPEGRSRHAPNTKASRYARLGEWRKTKARAAGQQE